MITEKSHTRWVARHRRSSKVAGVLAGACALALATASVAGACAQGGQSDSFSHSSQNSEAAAWTQWSFDLPTADNPLADPTICTPDEQGPVWFLPAASDVNQQTTCSIPEGKWLVLTPGGTIETQDNPTDSASVLRAEAKAATDDIGEVDVTVDGNPLRHLDRTRTTSIQTLELPADNILGLPAGPALTASDLYLVELPPLPVGQHVITEFARYDTGVNAGWTPGRTLQITVTPNRHH